MDDYSVSSLVESKNEWCARLITILTPALIVGIKSIFDEAIKLCKDNDEDDKYLMTFQTFLSRVPKWNNEIIESEKKRILEVTSCQYIEDLISCVHIVHLKALTCIRVGQDQKKVDIDIPSINNFIHKVYISLARKIYTNVYLFEKNIPPLNIQKHNRELEILIREAILLSIRDSMPIENILRAYISETNEEEVQVKEEVVAEKVVKEDKNNDQKDEKKKDEKDEKKKDEKDDEKNDKKNDKNENLIINPIIQESEILNNIKEEFKNKEKITTQLDKIKNINNENLGVESIVGELKTEPAINFTDTDFTINTQGEKSTKVAPKDLVTLEKIAVESNIKRKQDEQEEEEEEPSLKIGQEVKLELGSVNDLNKTLDINTVPELEIETLN
jgi:hypothetical protein